MMGSAHERTTKQICISPYNVPMTSWIATPNLSLHFLNTRGICCTATPKHTLEYSKVLCTKTKLSQTQGFTAGLQRRRLSACSPSNCAQPSLKGLNHLPSQIHIFSSFPWVLNPFLMNLPFHVSTTLVRRMDSY